MAEHTFTRHPGIRHSTTCAEATCQFEHGWCIHDDLTLSASPGVQPLLEREQGSAVCVSAKAIPNFQPHQRPGRPTAQSSEPSCCWRARNMDGQWLEQDVQGTTPRDGTPTEPSQEQHAWKHALDRINGPGEIVTLTSTNQEVQAPYSAKATANACTGAASPEPLHSKVPIDFLPRNAIPSLTKQKFHTMQSDTPTHCHQTAVTQLPRKVARSLYRSANQYTLPQAAGPWVEVPPTSVDHQSYPHSLGLTATPSNQLQPT